MHELPHPGWRPEIKLSLTAKLLLSFLVVGLTGTAILAFLGATATAGEFDRFMFTLRREGAVEQLAQYYGENQSWEGVPANFPWQAIGLLGRGERSGPRPVPFVLIDAGGQVIVSGPGHLHGERLSAAELSGAIPIDVEGERVGSLILQPGAFGPNAEEAAFLNRVNLALRIGAIGSAAVAVILGAVLARSVTRPLGELTAAARAVAHGDLEVQVPVRSSDELGELAAAFNQMNANLARARDLRRQMTADVAHELRTPISVILGHSEGIRDGVLEPSEPTLSIIHDEAVRLERLVEDLRLLSLVDAGELPLELGQTDPAELIQSAADSYRALAREKGVELVLDVDSPLAALQLDPDRTSQVLRNLLSNALRHTTTGGRITVSAKQRGSQSELQIADTGPGIPADELLHVFERFYRADKSRHRDGAGSGLGLAIARSLTEAQGGRLRVASHPDGGAVFTIEFPLPAQTSAG